MRKSRQVLAGLAAIFFGAAVLTACGGAAASAGSSTAEPASGPAEPTEAPEAIYRGEVLEVTGDGGILVAQLPGYDYGQAQILFHTDAATVVDAPEEAVAAGAFVQVVYSGVLTRSLPAQGTAASVYQLAAFSDGIIVNATIVEALQTDGGHTLTVLPLNADDDSRENQIVLTVPEDALEHLSAENLTAGTEISAVTSGIAALSLPPQMPVVALLPYSPAEGDEITPPPAEDGEGELFPGYIQPPADTALYRGVLEAAEAEGEDTLLTLRQAAGADYGAATLVVRANGNTLHSFQLADLTPGDYIEAWYGVSAGAGESGSADGIDSVAAAVLNRLPDVNAVSYSGTVTAMVPGDGGEGRLVLAPVGAGNEMIFNYGPGTQFYLDFDALATGDEINVFYNGVVASSLPPQGFALEVRPYSAG